MMWMPGDRVFDEEFDIREFAGAGGCADVYRAHWPARGGGYDVAIKVPRLFRLAEHQPGVFEAREGDRNLVRQALNECMQWAKCPKHPLIVEFKALRNQGPHVGLITEWVHGRPLDTVIEQEWDDLWIGGFQIAWRHPALIGLHTLDALRIVHRHDLLHLDITAGNVLVCRDNRHVKLTDFGLSSGAGRHQGTGPSIWGQSPGYAAPEVIKGQDASDQSDMFSWGVLMLRLAGSKPSMRRSQATPGADSRADLAQLHVATSMQEWMLSGEGPPAWRFPETIRELIRECVAPRPEDRPDANAAAERLRLFIKAETGHRPPEPPQEHPPDAGLIECMELLDKGEEAAFELSRLMSRGFHAGWLGQARTSEWAEMLAFKLGVHASGDNFGGMRDHFKVLLDFFERCCAFDGPNGEASRMLSKCLQIAIAQATNDSMRPEQSRPLLNEVERMLTGRQTHVVLTPAVIAELLDHVRKARSVVDERSMGQHSGNDVASHEHWTSEEPFEEVLCRAFEHAAACAGPETLAAIARSLNRLDRIVCEANAKSVPGGCGTRSTIQYLKDVLDSQQGERGAALKWESPPRDQLRAAVLALRKQAMREVHFQDPKAVSQIGFACADLAHALGLPLVVRWDPQSPEG